MKAAGLATLLGVVFCGGLFIGALVSKGGMLLPRALISVSATTVDVRGTWQLEEPDNNAWRSQTTTISCNRGSMSCIEVTAVVADESLLPLSINHLRIHSWTEQLVVLCGSTAQFISNRYVVDLLRHEARGEVGDRAAEGECPTVVTKRVKLVDVRKRGSHIETGSN
jgi:hypothetical protein